MCLKGPQSSDLISILKQELVIFLRHIALQVIHTCFSEFKKQKMRLCASNSNKTKIQNKKNLHATDTSCAVSHNNVAYVITMTPSIPNRVLQYSPQNGTLSYISSMYLANNVAIWQSRANCFISSRTQNMYVIGGQDAVYNDLGGLIRYKSMTDIANSSVPWQTQTPNVWFTKPIAAITPLYIAEYDIFVGIGGIDFTDTTGANGLYIFDPMSNNIHISVLPVYAGYCCAFYDNNIDRILFSNGARYLASSLQWTGIYATSELFLTPNPTTAPTSLFFFNFLYFCVFIDVPFGDTTHKQHTHAHTI